MNLAAVLSDKMLLNDNDVYLRVLNKPTTSCNHYKSL